MDGRADVSTQLTAQHKVEVSVVGTELILFPICGLTASIRVLRRLDILRASEKRHCERYRRLLFVWNLAAVPGVSPFQEKPANPSSRTQVERRLRCL